MRGNEVVNGQAIQCYEIRVCKGETPGFDRWTAAAKLVAIRQGIPYRWRSINDREIDLEIALTPNPLPQEGE